MDRARELSVAPLYALKSRADVGMPTTSSDPKDRVHLRVQVPHLCEGISKGDMTEAARNLGLPGTVSEISREGSAIPPDLSSSIQICTGIPAMSRPDDVPPVVPLVVPLNHCALPPPTRVVGESNSKVGRTEVLSARQRYESLKHRSCGT